LVKALLLLFISTFTLSAYDRLYTEAFEATLSNYYQLPTTIVSKSYKRVHKNKDFLKMLSHYDHQEGYEGMKISATLSDEGYLFPALMGLYQLDNQFAAAKMLRKSFAEPLAKRISDEGNCYGAIAYARIKLEQQHFSQAKKIAHDAKSACTKRNIPQYLERFREKVFLNALGQMQ
jgi:hypothetical protein